jgi:hypothetical protein
MAEQAPASELARDSKGCYCSGVGSGFSSFDITRIVIPRILSSTSFAGLRSVVAKSIPWTKVIKLYAAASDESHIARVGSTADRSIYQVPTPQRTDRDTSALRCDKFCNDVSITVAGMRD